MPLARMAQFYRQLAIMLRAGVSLSHALATLAAQPHPRAFRACLAALNSAVSQGQVFSAAMKMHPRFFSPFSQAMIAAGEASGDLDEAARRLAEHLEQELSLRQEIRYATFHSKLTLAGVLLCWPLVLAAYVNTPLLLCLLGILPMLTLAGLFGLTALLPRLSGYPSPFADQWLARMPILGPAASAIAQAFWARNLAFLYRAGLPLPEGVQLACASCGNTVLAARLQPTVARLRCGHGIADALISAGVLNPLVVTMLQTGQTTGELSPLLENIANHLQNDVSLTLHQVKVSVGVLLTLNLGVCVGLIAYQFYR